MCYFIKIITCIYEKGVCVKNWLSSTCNINCNQYMYNDKSKTNHSGDKCIFLKVSRSLLGFSDKFGQISVRIFVSTFKIKKCSRGTISIIRRILSISMGFMNKHVFIFVFSCLLFKQRCCFIRYYTYRF